MQVNPDSLNEQLEVVLIVERQVIEVLSRASVNKCAATGILRAVMAHIESLPSGSRI